MNRDFFKTTLIKLIRALNELIMAENELGKLQLLTRLVEEIADVADNYHNQTGKLHPDIGTDLSELLTMKEELIKSKAEGNAGYPEVIQRYHKEITAILNSFEKTR